MWSTKPVSLPSNFILGWRSTYVFSILLKTLRRFSYWNFKRSLTLPDCSINYTPPEDICLDSTEDICLGDYCTVDGFLLEIDVLCKEDIFMYGALSLRGYTFIDGWNRLPSCLKLPEYKDPRSRLCLIWFSSMLVRSSVFIVVFNSGEKDLSAANLTEF